MRIETRIETSLNQAKRTCQASRPYVLVRTAEAEGFEPPVPLGTLAFKASALDRSATLPIVHASGWSERSTQEAWSSTRCSATLASSLCGTAPRHTR